MSRTEIEANTAAFDARASAEDFAAQLFGRGVTDIMLLAAQRAVAVELLSKLIPGGEETYWRLVQERLGTLHDEIARRSAK